MRSPETRDGRDWIAATREVQASGKLSADEADMIVFDVAFAVMSGAADRDSELGRIAELLKPLRETHSASWDAHRAAKEKSGAGFNQPEPTYPDGLRELMDAYGVRFGELRNAFLASAGEQAVTQEMSADPRGTCNGRSRHHSV